MVELLDGGGRCLEMLLELVVTELMQWCDAVEMLAKLPSSKAVQLQAVCIDALQLQQCALPLTGIIYEVAAVMLANP